MTGLLKRTMDQPLATRPMELGQKLHVGASTGRPLFIDWEKVQNRAGFLDQGINALDVDDYRQFVWADPKAYEAQIAFLQGIDNPVAKAEVDAKITELQGALSVLQQNGKGKTEEQQKSEITFSQGFKDFELSWINFKSAVKDYHLFNWDAPAAWDLMDAYETQYFQFLDRFRSLGGTPSNPLPLPSDIDAQHPNDALSDVGKVLSETESMIKFLVIAALVGGAGYIGYKIFMAKPEGGSAGEKILAPKTTVNVETHEKPAVENFKKE